MSIEAQILAKLEPHAARIKQGNHNDFDFLPAVLLQLLQSQAAQRQIASDSLANVARQNQELALGFATKVGALADNVNGVRGEVAALGGVLVRQASDALSDAKTRQAATSATLADLSATLRAENAATHALVAELTARLEEQSALGRLQHKQAQGASATMLETLQRENASLRTYVIATLAVCGIGLGAVAILTVMSGH